MPDGREVATPFKSTQDLFDVDVREFFHGEDDCTEGGGGGGGLQGAYRESIRAELDGREDLGALLIEPVCQGAGGMKFIDPLWQRELVRYCRRRGMPVIYDEIFVGLYRFGYESTKDLLRIDPDIACYGKLLTGGTVPLGVTLATEDIFESFLDDGKANALLHGHSYTVGLARTRVYWSQSLLTLLCLAHRKNIIGDDFSGPSHWVRSSGLCL